MVHFSIRCTQQNIYMVLRKSLVVLLLIGFQQISVAQSPKAMTASEIQLQIKKLNVLGSVLYIAAHPDDENTRLLAYLANEKLYRTGYLSLTRGDGGQNLIGDEQGVELGLIRTQELLSARRIDGAEQFFSRAFDFGYSKSPEEALRIWGHDKILSDVVWVIRKFRPDVIIARFPTTGEGGHGHHTASAILAGEAFEAAADPTKFPEQLQAGVTVWQAKRLFWNTFNFGTVNTQGDDQLKLDCGDFNPFLGKSYGEIASASRSQHKSQGFGVAAQRGRVIEYFKTIKGTAPVNNLLEGVGTGWDRLLNGADANTGSVLENDIRNASDALYHDFSVANPERSIPALVNLYKMIERETDNYWRNQKLGEIKKIMLACSGLYLEASTGAAYAVTGDSLKINCTAINRLGASISNVVVNVEGQHIALDPLQKNINSIKSIALFIPQDKKLSQPYWLENPMEKGSFSVTDQQQIGKGESDPWSVSFSMQIEGMPMEFTVPIRYKYTDPVKGELFQPVSIVPPVSILPKDPLILSDKIEMKTTGVEITALRDIHISYPPASKDLSNTKTDITISPEQLSGLLKNQKKIIPVSMLPGKMMVDIAEAGVLYNQQLRSISYDHIPSINYLKTASIQYEQVDVKKIGNNIGYIPGAGDKVPDALMQMGYKVEILRETDMNDNRLKQFDAIVTGVRAYNTQLWLNNAYDVLMKYISDGGVLLVQYNTNNSIGPVKARISPFPFSIGSSRITDETATVNFLLPNDPALNYPNTITAKDFEGWIQERSTYHALRADSNYRKILSMNDPGEKADDGSLVIANYGKGRFVYAGLVFFRELPAAVPGAFRLFANLIANNRGKITSKTK